MSEAVQLLSHYLIDARGGRTSDDASLILVEWGGPPRDDELARASSVASPPATSRASRAAVGVTRGQESSSTPPRGVGPSPPALTDAAVQGVAGEADVRGAHDRDGVGQLLGEQRTVTSSVVGCHPSGSCANRRGTEASTAR